MYYKKMLILISTLLFCSRFLGLKAELDVMYLDFLFSIHDPDYFKDPETSVWENKFFVNITLIKYLPLDTEIRIQLLGATMGEYIVPTGIDVTLPIKEACDEPVFVASTLKLFKPPMKNCPPEPGTYIADVYLDDFSQFPDTFPPNYYLTRTTIFTLEKTLLVLDCYQRIS